MTEKKNTKTNTKPATEAKSGSGMGSGKKIGIAVVVLLLIVVGGYLAFSYFSGDEITTSAPAPLSAANVLPNTGGNTGNTGNSTPPPTTPTPTTPIPTTPPPPPPTTSPPGPHFILVGRGACRTASGGGGSFDAYGDLTASECRAMCAARSSCVAYESVTDNTNITASSKMGCELHKVPISKIASDGKNHLSGLQGCWRRVG